MTILRSLLAATRWVRHTWHEIREPRHVKVAYWCAYWVSVWTGVLTLIYPPQTITGEVGQDLTTAWSMLFIIGGAGGCATIFGGWWRYERAALGAIFGALGIYWLVVLWLHITSTGSRLTQLGIIVFAGILFGLRYAMIYARNYAPQETK